MKDFTEFNKWKNNRKQFVQLAKESDDYKGIKNLLTELYPDKAHFLYELLQNAEDMEASEVQFILNAEHLIFEHDGKKRDFEIQDIKAITGIGHNHKKNDPTSIGQFGVGFKAVYAYTDTPEIHSGEYDFKIIDMLIPEDEGVPQTARHGFTRFIFPLGTENKDTKTAAFEIDTGLRELDESAILFLSHIKKIRFQLSNGKWGCIQIKSDNTISHLYCVTQSLTGMVDQTTSFLKFDKPIDVTIKGENETRFVSIAYRVNLEMNNLVTFDSTYQGKVCIYFPAEKETSHLRFHINAPFASTVARDSVRNCSENKDLIKKIADLVTESIDWIKENKLLNRSFYSVLPNSRDFQSDQNSFFGVIQSKVKNKLLYSMSILVGNEFKYPKETIQLNGSVAKVFSVSDFKILEGHYYVTAAQPNTYEYYLLMDLGISTITENRFLQLLCEKSSVFHSIAKVKNFEWFISFFSLMVDIYQNTHYNADDFKRIRMIPTIDEELHCAAEDIFIKSDYIPQNIPSPQYVENEILENSKAQKFLKDIMGIPIMESKYDHIQEINAGNVDDAISGIIGILDEYRHMVDKKIFIEKYKGEPIFLSVHSHTQNFETVKATDCCWTKESAFFYRKLEYVPIKTVFGYIDAIKLCSRVIAIDEYSKFFDLEDLNDLKAMFVDLGGKVKPKIKNCKVEENPLCRQWIESHKFRRTKVDENDYSITGLENLSEIATSDLFKESLLLWKLVTDETISNNAKYLKGYYRPSINGDSWCDESTLVYCLKRTKWIPNTGGEFCLPCEIEQNELPPEFTFTGMTALLQAIGFGDKTQNIRELQTQIQTSFPEADVKQREAIALILKHPEIAVTLVQGAREKERLDLLEALAKQNKAQKESQEDDLSDSQPKVKNPERRKEKLQQEFEAGLKSPFKRTKKLRYSCCSASKEERGFVKREYRGKCQICDDPPIIKHDGSSYFQAVNIVTTSDLKDELLTKLDLGWNTLSLCPNCAAKYLYCSKNLDSFVGQIENTTVEKNSSKSIGIKIQLHGQEVLIKFTPKHFLALQKAFEVYGKD